MKQLNKLLALALAVIMVMALATTAFAEGDGSDTSTVTITVNNALADGEYKAYKIFDVTTSGSGENASYAYTIIGTGDNKNPFFDTVQTFATEQSGLTLTQIGTTEYNVTFDGDKFNAKSLSEALYKVVTDKNNPISYTEQATGTKGSDNNVTASFTGLTAGYYLITSPIGSTCILDTTVGTKEINEKNGLPTLVKSVNKEDDPQKNKDWAKCNDVDFGRTVEFKIEIQVGKTSDDYVLTDKLPTGFTLTTDPIQVQKQAKDSTTAADVPNDDNNKSYAVKTKDLTDGVTFEITFYGTYLSTLQAGDKLIVTYSAKVGKTAQVGGNGNANTATLTYGNNHSLPDSTKTYIWSFNVKKTDDSASSTPLAGAKFKLYSDENCSTEVTFDEKGNSQEEQPVTYQYDTNGTAELVTTSSGEFTLEGLDAGTYYLKETEAPAGYNKLEGPIKVEISATEGKDTSAGTLISSVTYGEWQQSVETDTSKHYAANLTGANDGTITVVNRAGALLPSTGGIGTTIFYVVGGILVVGAGVLLITKKRMNNSK